MIAKTPARAAEDSIAKTKAREINSISSFFFGKGGDGDDRFGRGCGGGAGELMLLLLLLLLLLHRS